MPEASAALDRKRLHHLQRDIVDSVLVVQRVVFDERHADIAVIDSVMAGYYMKSVDTFKDYQVLENVVLAEEKYGIAAKKGNDALMSKVNEALIALADTEYKEVDYMKYVNYEESKPGLQVMLPAGTIHSSGRNQVILEIGSLTIGSYTYKLYDYLRPDLDGKPRPIHTWHGERVLDFSRRTSAIHGTIVHEPRLVRKGDDWAEYIVGECEELYFSLRRLEFEKTIEDNTNGKFVVLTLSLIHI